MLIEEKTEIFSGARTETRRFDWHSKQGEKPEAKGGDNNNRERNRIMKEMKNIGNGMIARFLATGE